MRFRITQFVINNSLNLIQNLIIKSSKIETDIGIVISCFKKNILLEVNNTTLSYKSNIRLYSKLYGSIIVPNLILKEIINKIPKNEIILIFNKNDTSLNIFFKNSKFIVKCIPNINSENNFLGNKLLIRFTLDSNYLKSLIDDIKIFTSVNEIRKYVNSVYITIRSSLFKQVLTFVITDGYKLACSWKVFSSNFSNINTNILLPKDSIMQLRNLLQKLSVKSVLIELYDNLIRFIIKNNILTVALINDQFPNFEHIIPNEKNKFFNIDCSLLINSVIRVSNYKTNIRFIINKQDLLITSQSNFYYSSERLKLKFSNCINYESSFDSKSLIDILYRFNNKEITFIISNNTVFIYSKDIINLYYILNTLY